MTIGSPYNFSEQSMKKKSQMLSDFIKYSYRLPDDLIVYSVAGTETYTSDGLVPEKRRGWQVYFPGKSQVIHANNRDWKRSQTFGSSGKQTDC